MTDKTRTVGLIALLLLILAMVLRNGDIAWMTLPFLTFLMLGILRTPVREKLSFHAKRTLEQSRAHGVLSIAVRLSLQNESPETVHLFVEEPVQPGMKITEGTLGQWATLRPAESTELSYTFAAERGDFSWTSIRARVSDPLGLIATEMLL